MPLRMAAVSGSGSGGDHDGSGAGERGCDDQHIWHARCDGRTQAEAVEGRGEDDEAPGRVSGNEDEAALS